MSQSPTVSVVISTYNRSNLLPQAIQSVLAQDFRDFELIIIDDGSTDETRQVVDRFVDPRIRYVYQTNAGLAAGRNTGIRESRGKYIAFLDDDDLYQQDNLAIQTAFLKDHPEVGWCSGGFLITDMRGQVLDKQQPWDAFPDLRVRTWLFACPTCPSAVMVDRVWIDRIGGFDTQHEATDDWDAWLRLAQAGCRMAWVKTVACHYRLHDSNMIRGAIKIRQKRFAMLDQFFAEPTLTAELKDLKPQVYARAHLEEAMREYGAGLTLEGRSDLDRAISFDHELLLEKGKAVVGAISNYAAAPQIDDLVFYVNTVFQNLPASAESLLDQRRKAIGQAAMARFFRAHRFGNKRVVRRMLIIATRHDPTWLRNRGVWSIFAQTFWTGHQS